MYAKLSLIHADSTGHILKKTPVNHRFFLEYSNFFKIFSLSLLNIDLGGIFSGTVT